MSDEFVEHCVASIKQWVECFGRFYLEHISRLQEIDDLKAADRLRSSGIILDD